MFTQIHKKPRTRKICKSLIIISSILSLAITIIFTLTLISTHSYFQTTQILLPNFNLNYYNNAHNTPSLNPQTTPTNISHIVFSIAGVVKTWDARKHYVGSWWQSNITRGFLYIDQSPIQHLPWPPTSPPVRISSNHKGMPYTIRVARMVEEAFAAEKGSVRWYVMGDDDTVFFPENLVEVLKKYDHNGYYYVGMNSECVISNTWFSFGTAFGGAGFALSYPLVEILVNNLDVCLKKYQHLHSSDQMIQSCLSDLGVSLTQERGFHQIDLHGDISGLLSAHPHTPLVSLHHLDAVEPLFPAMDRPQALNHLMKAAKIDQSRLLQQSICYNHPKNWSISLSWGYSVHIYQKIMPSSFLQLPLQTFYEWKKGAKPAFMMNTRGLPGDPCENPRIYYFDSVESSSGGMGGGGDQGQVTTSYVRRIRQQLPVCLASGNHSADHVEKIVVISPVTRLKVEGNRRECCDVVEEDKATVTTIKLRPCMKYEIVG